MKVLESGQPIRRVKVKEGRIGALTDAIEAINEADVIVMGPGSYIQAIFQTYWLME